VERLTCPVRTYAWGSRTAIAGIQGRPVPSPQPEAELWAGAHPSAPAAVAGTPLTERIAADPVAALGRPVLDRFGPRLPFLMKLLAAEAPLSMQAHPDPEQAAAGYAAEKAAGVPVHAPHRRYVDPHHKPELLVAVSEFRALCGFQDPAASADLLAGLAVPSLRPVVEALRSGDLPGATARLLTEPAPVAEVAAAAEGRGGQYGVIGELVAAYPDDPAVIVALLLNQVALAPGEGIYMPAGNLHAYLHGVAVEVMAASDNVLRGGLTPKYVDAVELLRVLRFEPLDAPVLAAVPVAPGVVTWPVPAAEFSLHRISLDAGVPRVGLAVPGPRIVLCLAGSVSMDDGVAPVTLRAGEAGFGGGGAGHFASAQGAAPLTITGAGEVFLGSVGKLGISQVFQEIS
jgi:mannose-6-phosphate isomerase